MNIEIQNSEQTFFPTVPMGPVNETESDYFNYPCFVPCYPVQQQYFFNNCIPQIPMNIEEKSFESCFKEVKNEDGKRVLQFDPLDLKATQENVEGSELFVSFYISYFENCYQINRFITVPQQKVFFGYSNQNFDKSKTVKSVNDELKNEMVELNNETVELKNETVELKNETIEKKSYSAVVTDKKNLKKAEMIKKLINISSDSSLLNVTQNEVSKDFYDDLFCLKKELKNLSIEIILDQSFFEQKYKVHSVALLHSIAMSYIWGYYALPNWLDCNAKNVDFFFYKDSFLNFSGDKKKYFNSKKEILLNYCEILIKIRNQLLPFFNVIMEENEFKKHLNQFFNGKNIFVIKYFYKFILKKDLTTIYEENDVNKCSSEINEMIESMNHIDTYRKVLFKFIVLSSIKIQLDLAPPIKQLVLEPTKQDVKKINKRKNKN